MKHLTPFLQERTRKKVFKILIDLGFQYDTAGRFYWKFIRPGTSNHNRLCVGFGVYNALSGKNEDFWTWQVVNEMEPPRFGYSGTQTMGKETHTVKHIIDNTLEYFYNEGLHFGIVYGRDKAMRIAEEITELAKSMKYI